ncbi:MAG: class I SAM-dependent methyltransferase [Myxococcales bacterium FL481]|nr:MAG: class I SAM-dependent methyltransferase [Myxococcales bacterium FL481]
MVLLSSIARIFVGIGSASPNLGLSVDRRTMRRVKGSMKRAERSGVDRPQLSRLFESMAGDIVLRFVPGRRCLDLGRGSDAVLGWVRDRAVPPVETVDLEDLDVEALDLGLGRLSDHAFDVVYSLQTFPHLGDEPDQSEDLARRFLKQAARLCAPGGYVLVQVVNTRSLWGLLAGIRRPMTLVSGGTLVERRGVAITRFDTLAQFVRLLPPELELVDFHGFGVTTLSPRAVALPLVGRIAERTEWWLHGLRWPNAFGAHLLAVCRHLPKLMTAGQPDADADPNAHSDPNARSDVDVDPPSISSLDRGTGPSEAGPA